MGLFSVDEPMVCRICKDELGDIPDGEDPSEYDDVCDECALVEMAFDDDDEEDADDEDEDDFDEDDEDESAEGAPIIPDDPKRGLGD